MHSTQQLSQESDELEFVGPHRNLREIVLGIAVGSAAKTAAIHSIDARCQMRVGAAARKLGLIKADTAIALSLSLAHQGPYGKVGQTINFFDDRLGVAKGWRTLMDKIFPDYWSFMLSEIALYSFLILLVTYILLSFYFVPSSAIATYRGSYLPFDDQKVT